MLAGCEDYRDDVYKVHRWYPVCSINSSDYCFNMKITAANPAAAFIIGKVLCSGCLFCLSLPGISMALSLFSWSRLVSR